MPKHYKKLVTEAKKRALQEAEEPKASEDKEAEVKAEAVEEKEGEEKEVQKEESEAEMDAALEEEEALVKLPSTEVLAGSEVPAEHANGNSAAAASIKAECDEKDDEKMVSEGEDPESVAHLDLEEAAAEDEEKKEDEAMKEGIRQLFTGKNLSEDFTKKAEMVFEAAVKSRFNRLKEKAKPLYAKRLSEAKVKMEAALVEKLDQYLDYVVTEWVKDNTVALEENIHNQITESFIQDLNMLFRAHNIEVPKGKMNLVDELAEQVEALQNRLNESEKRNMALSKTINESKRSEILREARGSLSDNEFERLKGLANEVIFESEDAFKDKVKTLKETYFPAPAKKSPGTKSLTEDLSVEAGGIEGTVEANGQVAEYVKAHKRLFGSK